MPPEVCPHCGAAVPPQARACPGCGADENTGWAEDAQQTTAADVGLPDEEFDYEDFTRREFGSASSKPRGLHWVWWLTGLVVLLAIILFWIL